MFRLCYLEAQKWNQAFNPPAYLYLAADSIPVESKRVFCPLEDLVEINFLCMAL